MVFKYELVKVGNIPTWKEYNKEPFQNPIHVGEVVKPSGSGSPLLKIVAVEHYSSGSIAYVESATPHSTDNE